MAAREAGITLIVVAVSDWVNDNEVKEIATDPDERNVIRVVNFNQINTVTDQLAGILCNSTFEIFILITQAKCNRSKPFILNVLSQRFLAKTYYNSNICFIHKCCVSLQEITSA